MLVCAALATGVGVTAYTFAVTVPVNEQMKRFGRRLGGTEEEDMRMDRLEERWRGRNVGAFLLCNVLYGLVLG